MQTQALLYGAGTYVADLLDDRSRKELLHGVALPRLALVRKRMLQDMAPNGREADLPRVSILYLVAEAVVGYSFVPVATAILKAVYATRAPAWRR